MCLFHSILAVQLVAHLLERDLRAGLNFGFADHLHLRGHEGFGQLAHAAFRHRLGGGDVGGHVLVGREREGRVPAVLLASLARRALGLHLGDDVALCIGIPAVDRDLADLRAGLETHLHLLQPVAWSDRDRRAPGRRTDHQLLALDAQMIAARAGEPAQQRGVRHVGLQDVLLRTGWRFRGQAVLLRDLPGDFLSVHLKESARAGAEREAVNRFLADDAQRGGQVPAELRLQRDDFSLEDLRQVGAEADFHLDRDTGIEVLSVDEQQLGIVERQRALAEQIDGQIDRDAGEPRILDEVELLPRDAHPAVGDQPLCVGVGHEASPLGVARGLSAPRDDFILSVPTTTVQALPLTRTVLAGRLVERQFHLPLPSQHRASRRNASWPRCAS